MILRRATLRLTITYAAALLVLFAVFSIAIYVFVTGHFDVESSGTDSASPEIVLLRNGLIASYVGLLVLIPPASWLLARAALRPVRESFERQQDFVDGASHEMRTPLSLIQDELELALTRPRTGPQYREAITSALDAAAGLDRLSDDLLRLSEWSREHSALAFTMVDVGAAVDAAINQEASAARAARVQVATEPYATAHVLGSRELLIRAVSNILNNAIKFSSPETTVTVTVTTAQGHVLVRVQDRGPGMAAGEVRHAFERFWRADTARSTPGHGLGLALVDQIMRAHQGEVALTSGLGEGTTVTLQVPLAVS